MSLSYATYSCGVKENCSNYRLNRITGYCVREQLMSDKRVNLSL